MKAEEDQSGGTPPFQIVTACYGQKFWAAVPGWVAHLRALSGAPIEILSLDGIRYDEAELGVVTTRADVGTPIDPGVHDMMRLALILRRLAQGRICVQMDVDVVLKRDIAPLVSLPYDFVVSRASAFPAEVKREIGFVACTGFYIAKPSAREFCDAIGAHARSGTYGALYDQVIINHMLLEARRAGAARLRTVDAGGESLDIDEFEIEGCRIGVLPDLAILRGSHIDLGIYGAHHPELLDRFLPVADAVAAEQDQNREDPL